MTPVTQTESLRMHLGALLALLKQEGYDPMIPAIRGARLAFDGADCPRCQGTRVVTVEECCPECLGSGKKGTGR
jgi:hypothetical protein